MIGRSRRDGAAALRDRPRPAPAAPGFRTVPHISDVGLEIRGRTWEELYLNAARGLLSLYAPEGKPLKESVRKAAVEAESPEDTLVLWLNEIIFLVSTKHWLPTRIIIREGGPKGLEAELRGGPTDAAERPVRLKGEIKAATYHNLKVRRRGAFLSAGIVLDV
ncbi:MAG: archease [Elusimicrobiota bacterium]